MHLLHLALEVVCAGGVLATVAGDGALGVELLEAGGARAHCGRAPDALALRRQRRTLPGEAVPVRNITY